MRGLSSEDRREIQEVIYRYAWALDTGDVDRFVDCFDPDGILIWDAFETPDRYEGAESLRRFATFLRDLPGSAGRQHLVGNTLIEGEGDEARASSYAIVFTRQAEGSHLVGVMGWYEDVLRRSEAGWRIRERVIRDWSGPVLARFAGQSGERVARPRPAVLAPLASPFPAKAER
jgi:3-phenylpropionate/cinnamic acid dioxygenase small subunit